MPKEAQQVILFLAPETGGDFSTLRSAVRGRPGVFVRASQDLLEAGFEQARIEKYVASMRFVPAGDPKALIDHSNFLARTLSLKPNEECFQRPIDLQYNCLTQTGNQTLLDDGHGETIVSSLTNATNAGFYSAASSTSLMGGGLYSAYVGAVVDLVRIMSGLHTAHYQYIPAIAFPSGESLNLRLNTPPSFNNPKSVIVIGLPAIQSSTPPPLRVADAKQISCLLKPVGRPSCRRRSPGLLHRLCARSGAPYQRPRRRHRRSRNSGRISRRPRPRTRACTQGPTTALATSPSF